MDFTDQVNWENAKAHVTMVGLVPATFTSAVRTLKNNHQKNQQSETTIFTSESKFLACRLLKSRSLLAPFFYATMTLYPEKTGKAVGLSGEQILKFHNPNEASNLFTLIFYYRRIKRFCNPEAWTWLEENLQQFSDIGILLGKTVPSIGVADGLIVGTMRHLALGVFMARDNKIFQTYKRHLKSKDKAFDLEEEVKQFGTTHVHVASILLQLMGFGVQYADIFARGLLSTPIDKLDKESGKIRLIATYIEALQAGEVPPKLPDESNYEVSESGMDQIVDESNRIRESGSQYSWISKRKEDISSSTTPQLLLSDESSEDAEIGIDEHQAEA